MTFKFQPVHLRIRLLLTLIILATLIAGCGAQSRSAEPEATVASPATVTTATVATAPTAPPAQVVLPTVTPNTAAATVEAAPAEPVDWTTHAYREGDYYILGNPDAPVRLIDYSDFL